VKLATQDKPFFPKDFKDKLQAIGRMGFDAFEIDGKILVDHFDEVKRATELTGIPIAASCGGYRGWIGDFDRDHRMMAISDITVILERLSMVSGRGIVVPAAWGMFSKRLPPMEAPRSEEEDTAVLLESLRQLDEAAGRTGTIIFLEPLNRYEDHMVNKLEDAYALLRAGSFANVKIVADFYHMNIEEQHIDISLRQAGEAIGHVHLADSNRYEPGQGHLDFTPGFKALKDNHYEGYMTFECRVLGVPEEEAYRASVRYIQHLWESA